MRLRELIAVLMLALPAICAGADNEQLLTIVQADQAERQQSHTNDEWIDIAKRDAQRRIQVQAELNAGRIKTAVDFFNAALVMQHGATLEDIRMAHALASIAASIDPQNRSASWLKAASWDRMMLTQKKPQWYGTQYVKDANGKWMLYEVDESAVTDAQRMELGAPTLAQARQRVDEMNKAR